MANATLQNLGTLIRHTNAELQRVRPTDDERPSINVVKERGTGVVDVLDTLGAGTPPVPDTTEVDPTADTVEQWKKALFIATARLDSMIAANPPPAPLANLQDLKARVLELDAAVGVAQNRVL
jgi:hypothetical protein